MKLILYLAIGGMIGTLARYALGGLLQPSSARPHKCRIRRSKIIAVLINQKANTHGIDVASQRQPTRGK